MKKETCICGQRMDKHGEYCFLNKPMPFKDTKEGQTHYENDGCGEPEHNKPMETKSKCCELCEGNHRNFTGVARVECRCHTPLPTEDSWEEEFEKQFKVEGDERYGRTKHHNTVLDRQIIFIKDLLRTQIKLAYEKEHKNALENMYSEDEMVILEHAVRTSTITEIREKIQKIMHTSYMKYSPASYHNATCREIIIILDTLE